MHLLKNETLISHIFSRYYPTSNLINSVVVSLHVCFFNAKGLPNAIKLLAFDFFVVSIILDIFNFQIAVVNKANWKALLIIVSHR